MVVRHNLNSINAHRNMKIKNKEKGKSIEKLSSGLRINRAGDDAAGLAISEKMRSQIRGINQGSRNAQDGISLVQTAEGALEEVHNMLQRARTLSVQSANGTYTDDDRSLIQKEITQITEEIDRITDNTEFNGKKLFDGTYNGGSGSSSGSIGSNGSITPTSFTQQFNINSGSVNITSDGVYKISGTGTTGNTITIASGVTATIVIDNVNVDTSSSVNVTAFEMTGANVNLILTGNNSFKSGDNCAGISVPETSGIKISGSGSLTAQGGAFGAGIGGRSGKSGGDITIESGNITAIGGTCGFPPIGGGAGIGSGASGDSSMSGGNIIIKGGTVNATGTANAAGIGGSGESKGGTISIEGGTVNATGNNASAIGKGPSGSDNGVITVNGITVPSVGASYNVSLPNVVNPSNSSSEDGLHIQVGNKEGQYIGIDIEELSTTSLGINTINISTKNGASNALSKYDGAINKVSQVRGTLGAIQNRLEHSISSLDNTEENLQASESRIRDTDMAKEIMEYTKNNILTNAAQNMLIQANQSTNSVLQLLG